MRSPEIIKYYNNDKELEKMLLEKVQEFEARGLIEEFNNGLEIGTGRTAVVKVLEENPAICLKAIRNKKISRNDSLKEMGFLDRLAQKGYAVPKPVCIIHTAQTEYIFLETIATENNATGISLEDLIEKDLFSELPENFDFKKFFNSLNKIIFDLNTKEKIYHRDLHLGNIMIGPDGLPVIIDFGDAEEITGNQDPHRRINAKGEIEIIHSDREKTMEAYREVGQYLKENNYFKK